MGRAPLGQEKGVRAQGDWVQGRGREAGKSILLSRGGEEWAGVDGGPRPAGAAHASMCAKVPEAGPQSSLSEEAGGPLSGRAGPKGSALCTPLSSQRGWWSGRPCSAGFQGCCLCPRP